MVGLVKPAAAENDNPVSQHSLRRSPMVLTETKSAVVSTAFALIGARQEANVAAYKARELRTSPCSHAITSAACLHAESIYIN